MPKIKHPKLSDVSWEDRHKLTDYLKSPDFDAQTYHDLLTDKIEDPESFDSLHKEHELESHPHNNPENNAAAIDELLPIALKGKGTYEHDFKELKGDKFNRNPHDAQSKIKAIINHSKFDSKYLLKLADKEPSLISHVLKNPSFNQDDYQLLLNSMVKKAAKGEGLEGKMKHWSSVGEKDPIKAMMHDDRFDEQAYKKLEKVYPQALRENLPAVLKHANKYMSPEQQTYMLTHPEALSGLGIHDFSRAVDRAHPQAAKAAIDNRIGLTGSRPADEGYVGTDDDWDNRIKGPGYKDKTAAYLAEHHKLDEDQINHIKRHGSFEEVLGLLNNKHVPIEHHLEMLDKWHNDDSGHGYDKYALREHLKKENRDDAYEKFHDDAREEVQQNYSMEDYVRDVGSYAEFQDESDLVEHAKKNPGKFDLKYQSEDADGEEEDYSDDPTSHPDWDDKKEEIAQDMYNQGEGDWDKLYEGYDESIGDDVYSRAIDMHNEQYDDDDFIYNEDNLPDHLHGKIPKIEEIKRKKAQEKEENDWNYRDSKNTLEDLNLKHGFKHEKEDQNPIHEYGPNQHFHETVKDFADNNGGKIDIGTLIKKFPNAKERFQEIFFGPEHVALNKQKNSLEQEKAKAKKEGQTEVLSSLTEKAKGIDSKIRELENGKQVITSEQADQKLQALPKDKYHISFGKWGSGNMQNINGQNQLVMRLDHSKDTYDKLRSDPESEQMMNKVHGSTRYSGHPVNQNSIAWARVDTSNPKHWMIDEVQSDYEKVLRREGDQIKEKLKNGEKIQGIESEADVDNLVNSHQKALDKINKFHGPWREAMLNAVIKHAKANGVEKISTHSPESKAAHVGARNESTIYKRSYHQIPRLLGFKETPGEELPLTEKGKERIQEEAEAPDNITDKDRMDMHVDAMRHHAMMWGAHGDLSREAAEQNNPELEEKHHNLAVENHKFFRHHGTKAKQLDPLNADAKRSINDTIKVGKSINSANNNTVDFKGLATQASEKGRFAPHKNDEMLQWGEKTGKLHTGHTLDITPNAFKKSEYDIILTNIQSGVYSMQMLKKNRDLSAMEPINDAFLDSKHPISKADLAEIEKHINWSNSVIDKAHPDHDQDVLDWHDQYLARLHKRLDNSIKSLKGKA